MKKSVRILLIVLAVVLVLGGAGAFVLLRLDHQAKQAHEQLASALEARESWLQDTRVRLTENGVEIGSYSLEDLGLAQNVRAALTSGLSQTDLLPENEFEALGIDDRLSWRADSAAQVHDAARRCWWRIARPSVWTRWCRTRAETPETPSRPTARRPASAARFLSRREQAPRKSI